MIPHLRSAARFAALALLMAASVTAATGRVCGRQLTPRHAETCDTRRTGASDGAMSRSVIGR